MHLINSVSVSSPENFAYLDLLIGVLKHEMAEDVYHADAASLTYGLSASSRGGLIIKVLKILCASFSFKEFIIFAILHGREKFASNSMD